MEIVRPKSTRIEEVQYFAVDSAMTVEFKRGGTYRYTPIDEELWDNLRNAESMGKAFNELVKGNQDISFERVA